MSSLTQDIEHGQHCLRTSPSYEIGNLSLRLLCYGCCISSYTSQKVWNCMMSGQWHTYKISFTVNEQGSPRLIQSSTSGCHCQHAPKAIGTQSGMKFFLLINSHLLSSRDNGQWSLFNIPRCNIHQIWKLGLVLTYKIILKCVFQNHNTTWICSTGISLCLTLD